MSLPKIGSFSPKGSWFRKQSAICQFDSSPAAMRNATMILTPAIILGLERLGAIWKIRSAKVDGALPEIAAPEGRAPRQSVNPAAPAPKQAKLPRKQRRLRRTGGLER